MVSKEGRNEGIPATSRYGANIEINALALTVLKFFTQFSLDKPVKTDLVTWLTDLSRNWDCGFWNEQLGRYNDTILGDSKGDKLRPNGLYALSQIPVEAVDKTHATRYIQQCEESLVGPLGMRTLPATDPDYNGWYDNSDDSGGYNYHNGPEWVWLMGHFVIAAKKFSVLDNGELWQILDRHYEHLMISSIVCKSLPELTNTNGAFCHHSCPSQAWSVCCLLEAIEWFKQ
jgi:glycogen debranching enzyme